MFLTRYDIYIWPELWYESPCLSGFYDCNLPNSKFRFYSFSTGLGGAYDKIMRVVYSRL